MERKFLGTTIDLAPARRDCVLAGGFSSLVAWGATLHPAFLIYGAASGGMLGVVLHVLPPEPKADDNRVGRIAVRGVSGAVAGVCLAPGLLYMSKGAALNRALAPSSSAVLLAAVLGLVLGLAWYIGWGIWETRNLERDAAAATAGTPPVAAAPAASVSVSAARRPE
jgi:hypothetical protein